MKIANLRTPCLLIDSDKMQRNIARLSEQVGRLHCTLRPHVKTHKSVAITKAIEKGGNTKGITVSTLKEAEYFFAAGYRDILYAVGIAPNKFSGVSALMQQGCDIKVILDSVEAVTQLQHYAHQHDCTFNAMIELDVDNHRAGVQAESDDLMVIATLLDSSPGLNLIGVMTHAGGSYDCFDRASQEALAIQERDLSLLAARRIRDAGIACPVVSIGSTPTAFAIDNLIGITEVRAGVYVLFDLVMAGLGVCSIDDIAISVLGSIIGFQKQKQIALTDAGWMAMSRDRGTSEHRVDQGYGVICDLHGNPRPDMILHSANQEHGIIAMREADALFPFDQFDIGTLVRVLPNHACSTAAQYDDYYLVSDNMVIAKLASISGW
jgi:D-serine deaminase-like pyridoxal phosphate-dependent protein